MPLGYEIFAGNRNDATTLKEMVGHIEGLYGRASPSSAVEAAPQLFWPRLKAAEPRGQESRLLFPSRCCCGWASPFRKADVVTTNPLESEP
jgi:hypothetical protein